MTKQNHTPMLAVLFGTAFIAAFNENIINVGLADIMAEFAISANTANWLVTGYMIVTAIIVSVVAFLLRRLTLRTIFFLGSGLFVVGCGLAYIAPNFPLLLCCRLLQAVGTGVFIPTMMNTVLAVAPRKKLGVYLSIGGCCITFGPAFGPVISGLMVTFFGWRSMFLVPLIAMAVLLVAGALLVRNVHETRKVTLDIPSVILSVVGLTALVYGLSQVTSDLVIGIIGLALGIGVLAAFVIRQRTTEHPLLNLAPLENRRFSVACILVIVAMMTTFSMSVLLPLYFEGAHGVSALIAGLLLLVPILAQAVTSIIGGKMMDNKGDWPVLPLGFLLMSIGLFAASFCAGTMSIPLMVLASTIAYAGVGFGFSPSQTAGLKNLPHEMNPFGVGLMSTFIQMSAAVGPSLFVGVLSTALAAGGGTPQSYATGFSDAVMLALVFGIIGLVSSFFYARTSRHVPGAAPAAQAGQARQGEAPAGERVAAPLTISTAMKRDVFSIPDTAKVYEAVELMLNKQTSGLPVVNAAGSVVGFISDGDIMKSIAPVDSNLVDLTYSLSVFADDKTFDVRIDDVMRSNVMELATENVVAVTVDTTIERACTLLGERRIKKVPVLEGTKLVGTLSRSDVTRRLMAEFIAQGRPETVEA